MDGTVQSFYNVMFSLCSIGIGCVISLFVCFNSLHQNQQFFSQVGMGPPGLNQY